MFFNGKEYEINRNLLGRALKWALRPDPWREKRDRQPSVSPRYTPRYTRKLDIKKLEGSAAWLKAEKSRLPELAWRAALLHYQEGLSIKKVASVLGVSEVRAAHFCSGVISYLARNAPPDILISLCPTAFSEEELINE